MHWHDIEIIVEALEQEYAEEKIPEDNIQDLREMVLSLDDFEDHEVEVDTDQLKKILEYWLEYRGTH